MRIEKYFWCVLSGAFLGLALVATTSLSYYYEELAFSNPLGAVFFVLLIVFICMGYRVTNEYSQSSRVKPT